MDRVLQLLLEGESLTSAQMAEVLNLSEEEVAAKLKQLSDARILLGWRPVLNPAHTLDGQVRAVIEVKVTPERGGGFDRLAERISRFDEVESCYLMSGGYDLLVFARASTLHGVASFISSRLSSMEGVLSTATHFVLQAYKEQNYYLGREGGTGSGKPSVSP